MILLAAVFAFMAGCSENREEQESRTGLSERERDSTLAETRLPGAGGVKKALAVSDSASARAARFNKVP
jgi:hypothetical protein